MRGEIVALERAATVLRSDDGCTVRVPNHFLLESIVMVDERPEDGHGAARAAIRVVRGRPTATAG